MYNNYTFSISFCQTYGQ